MSLLVYCLSIVESPTLVCTLTFVQGPFYGTSAQRRPRDISTYTVPVSLHAVQILLHTHIRTLWLLQGQGQHPPRCPTSQILSFTPDSRSRWKETIPSPNSKLTRTCSPIILNRSQAPSLPPHLQTSSTAFRPTSKTIHYQIHTSQIMLTYTSHLFRMLLILLIHMLLPIILSLPTAPSISPHFLTP